MKTESYITRFEYEGRTVEVVGEVHDTPIKKSENGEMHTRIQVLSHIPAFNNEAKEVFPAFLFEVQMTQNELATECEFQKTKLPELLKTYHADNVK